MMNMKGAAMVIARRFKKETKRAYREEDRIAQKVVWVPKKGYSDPMELKRKMPGRMHRVKFRSV